MAEDNEHNESANQLDQVDDLRYVKRRIAEERIKAEKTLYTLGQIEPQIDLTIASYELGSVDVSA